MGQKKIPDEPAKAVSPSNLNLFTLDSLTAPKISAFDWQPTLDALNNLRWTMGSTPIVQAPLLEPIRVVRSQFRLPWYWLEEALEACHAWHLLQGRPAYEALGDYLRMWGWGWTADDQGSLDSLFWNSAREPQLSAKGILTAIAPFVEAGSFVEFAGGTEKSWRWVFHDREVVVIHPVVSWPLS